MALRYENAGAVRINSQNYRLVRLNDGRQQAYVQDWLDEPPYAEGLPTMLHEETVSWHLGGFKSRQGIPSTSEYGINTDGRWPFRLVPGPKITTIELPNSDAQPSFAWADGSAVVLFMRAPVRLWIVADSRVFRCTNAGAALLVYYDETKKPIMGVEWQGDNYMVLSDDSIVVFEQSTSDEVPNGAGASTQWTPSAGSNFQNVDETTHDSASTYNQSSTAGHIDLFTFGDLSGFHDGAVPSPNYFIAYARTATGGVDPVIRPVCRVGTTNYFGAPLTLENDTDYHETSTADFQTNPATGAAWTQTEFNAAQFGYELQVAPGAGAVRVTMCYMQVVMLNWTTVDAQAKWLAVGPKRLFKVDVDSGAVHLKNIDPGLDPTDESDWADDVIIPGQKVSGSRVPLAPFQKTAIVATDKGTYGVDIDGTGVKIIERLPVAPTTLHPWDPWLLISHGHGLFRWVPGLAESCGLEREILNESPVRGVMDSFAAIGRWLFAAVLPPSGNTQILVGRDRDAGEPGTGPMIWDTLIEAGEDEIYKFLIVGKVGGTVFDNSDGDFGLFFPQGNNIGYCIFPATTGGSPEIDADSYRFATSGSRFTPRYRFDDWRDKDFPKIVVVGEDVTENVYWDVAYSIDGGAFQTTDADGNTMRVDSEGLHTFYLPTSAKGREIQFRFSYTSDDDTACGKLLSYDPFAMPQSQKVPVVTIHLLLGEDIREDEGTDLRAPIEQLNDLVTLQESAAAVATYGPWGENKTAWLRRVRLIQTEQEGHQTPQFVVQVQLQMRESS